MNWHDVVLRAWDIPIWELDSIFQCTGVRQLFASRPAQAQVPAFNMLTVQITIKQSPSYLNKIDGKLIVVGKNLITDVKWKKNTSK